MIRNDIEKLMAILPSTLYSVKFFLFQQKLTKELSDELNSVKQLKEMFGKSHLSSIETKRHEIINSDDKTSIPYRLAELQSEPFYEDYILLVEDISKYLTATIKTEARINLEDVPDKFVESLDDDGIRIFSEFFI